MTAEHQQKWALSLKKKERVKLGSTYIGPLFKNENLTILGMTQAIHGLVRITNKYNYFINALQLLYFSCYNWHGFFLNPKNGS